MTYNNQYLDMWKYDCNSFAVEGVSNGQVTITMTFMMASTINVGNGNGNDDNNNNVVFKHHSEVKFDAG